MFILVLLAWSGSAAAAGRLPGRVDGAVAPLTRIATAVAALPRFGPRLRRGVFLVARPDMLDPNFAQTVVLLVEYGDEGALGIIINRPTEHRLESVLPDMAALKGREDRVYLGGPVAPGQVIVLLRAAGDVEAARHVVDDIYVSASRTPVLRMIERNDPAERFHAFAGHAGWAPGQLESELARGGWRIAEADAEMVFDIDAAEIWPALMRRTSGIWVRLPCAPPALHRDGRRACEPARISGSRAYRYRWRVAHVESTVQAYGLAPVQKRQFVSREGAKTPRRHLGAGLMDTPSVLRTLRLGEIYTFRTAH